MSESPPLRAARRKPTFAVVLIAVVIGLSVIALPILLLVLESGVVDRGASNLPAPPPPRYYGTAREIGSHGDSPNPRALYHGTYPSNPQTQERQVGGLPARFSGYTAWVRSVVRVPARPLVHVYPGFYLRVHVTVFNRDTQSQGVCACDFYVYSRRYGVRDADAVRAPSLGLQDAASGAKLDADVYLYIGRATGPMFVVYDPDGNGHGIGSYSGEVTADAVWKVPAARS